MRGALVLALLCAGCGDGGKDEDTKEPVCGVELPPVSNPCLGNGCGNALGVGRSCSKRGGECNDQVAIFCTIDFDATTNLAYCTKPCVDDTDCGASAVCAADPGDPSNKGCLPAACE